MCSQLEWDGLTQAIIQVRDLSPDKEKGERAWKKGRVRNAGEKKKDNKKKREREKYCYR